MESASTEDRDASAPKAWTAEEIAALIFKTPFRYDDESGLQAGLALLFAANDIPFEREVRLSPESRIDFLVDRIGIEVKVDSSTPVVLRQLQRYALEERIGSLLLVTSRTRHKGMPEIINGKPLYVVHLLVSMF